MPNALGTLSPDVLTLDVIQFLKKRFPALTAIATDFSNEPVRFNTRIVSRVVTVPAVASYTQGGGYASGNATTVDVPVQINNFRYDVRLRGEGGHHLVHRRYALHQAPSPSPGHSLRTVRLTQIKVWIRSGFKLFW